MNIEQVIRDYIPGTYHLSLATSRGNKPWVCEVHFAYDDDLNLYFMSKSERRHSLEIADNPNVSGNIIVQHALSDKPRGIYFEGTAVLQKNVDANHQGYIAYTKRMDNPNISFENLYKITVTDYYVFDARESDPSQKYHLPR